jgi:hypothetical protein
MQKKNATFQRLVLVLGFSILLVSSVAGIFPGIVFGQTSTTTNAIHFGGGVGGSIPDWAFQGAYLNYTISFSANGKLTLSNGSSLSASGSLSGSVKITVNNITNETFLGETLQLANVTEIPNFALTSKLTYFNGTSQTHDMTETAANATTSDIPLTELNFGNLLQNELNSTSSLYSFSPTLNTSLSAAPGVLYQYNSTTKVPALYLTSSVTEKTSLPSNILGSTSGSYSLNGTSNMYIALVQDLPLSEVVSLQGSASVQNLQLSAIAQSATGSGSLSANLVLSATNIDLSAGSNVQQSTISIPNYSTSLDVMSNSTINGASTSGNELIVNVTGPSGTRGVTDVVVSPSLLSGAGITNPSQVGVTVDGTAYTNYTVTDVGGSYVFAIYYHHSSHVIGMTFGNANLGTNTGKVLAVTGSSASSSSLMSTTTILEIVGVVIVVIVVVAIVAFTRRSRGSMAASAPTAAPSPAQ